MAAIFPLYGIENTTSPLMAGGKIAGNIGAAPSAPGAQAPFRAMFDQALENVAQLDAVKNNDSYNLAIGDLDDLGALATNSSRAQVAFELLVQMRNKVLDSYQEIMRMNV